MAIIFYIGCMTWISFEGASRPSRSALFKTNHGPEKVPAATYRDFPRISIILKFRAFLQLFPRFSLKSKQNTEIEFRLLKTPNFGRPIKVLRVYIPLQSNMHFFRRPIFVP